MEVNKLKNIVSCARIALAIGIVSVAICRTSYAEELQIGKKYKIIKTIYIMGQYDSGNNRTISKETARAYLNSVKLASRYFTAFQYDVPVGTIVTIIGRAPKAWYLYFNSDYYFVALDPDVSQGLEVRLPLNSSFEGNLDGLNPEIFSRLNETNE